MERVCSWCQQHMGSLPEAGHGTTHGICPICRFHIYASRGMEIHEYLEGLEFPILLVDGEGTVSSANRAARQMMGKDFDRINGLPPGNIFECPHSYLPGGCGNTEHCKKCGIRGALVETMKTGVGRDSVWVELAQRQVNGAERTLALRVSTETQQGVVMLRIEEVR